jgi:exodeoxyribonuclease III
MQTTLDRYKTPTPELKQTDESISPSTSHEFQVCSWNIDGLRPDVWQWLKAYLLKHRPHVMCLNETKKTEAALIAMFAEMAKEYEWIINSHNPARYHGVAMLIRKDVPFRRLDVTLNCEIRSDTKSTEAGCGRVIAAELDKRFIVVATYSPNAGVDRKQPLKNLGYRTQQWDPALFSVLEQMRAMKPTVWIGDINVAPANIDVSNPKQMARKAGFTKQERESFENFVKSGKWVDCWRQQHPTATSYTFRGKPEKWSRSFGMRLDNCIVSADLQPRVTKTFHVTECSAPTDHVPLGAVLCF